MTDLRPGDSFFRLLCSREGFLRSVFTTAVLNSDGKTPETRDELITCVTAGKSSTNKKVGMGSSEQVFGTDLSITFRTCSSETG